MADTVAHPPENGTAFVDGAAKDAEEPAHDNAVKADSKKGEEKLQEEEGQGEEQGEEVVPADVEMAEPEVGKVEVVGEVKERVEDVEMAEPELKDGVEVREEKEKEGEQEVAVVAEVEEGKQADAEVGETKEGGEGEVNEGGEEEGTGTSPAKRGPGRPKKAKSGEEKEKSPRKAPRSRTPKKEKEVEQLPAFASDRPSRERKSIERFIATVDKGKNKEIQIKQGEGEALKDIPNVAYKLSKRTRNDEILSMLHTLLFHKRGKATVLKYHILQFSGYVWEGNEEKERARVKEKLERYTKEGLISLVDLLDLHLSRTGKKEELVLKLLEFLEKPHKTTDVLLEEKEQRKSAGKRPSSGKKPGRPKKQKVDGDSSTKKGSRKSTEGSDADESGKGDEDDSLEEEEIEKKRLTFKDDSEEEDQESVEEREKSAKKSEGVEETEEKGDEEEGLEEAPASRKKAKVSAPDSPSKSSTKPVEKVYTKSPRKSSEKKNKIKEKKEEKEKDKEPKATPAKKGPGRPRKSDATPAKKDASSTKKSATTGKKSTLSAAKDKDSGKKNSVKETKPKKSKIPTDEEMQIQIRLLLKDADFSKVTFTDVVSQLEEKFGVTLVEQKSHVKKLIKEEISKLTEEGDDEGEAEVEAEAEAEAEVEVGAADNDKVELTKEDEPEGVTTPGTGPNEDAEQPVEAVEGD